MLFTNYNFIIFKKFTRNKNIDVKIRKQIVHANIIILAIRRWVYDENTAMCLQPRYTYI